MHNSVSGRQRKIVTGRAQTPFGATVQLIQVAGIGITRNGRTRFASQEAKGLERKMDPLTGFSRHFGGMGRALSARNYRVYWYGHLLSSNGIWIYLISSQWLIFHLTESSIWLGTIGFAYLAPLFFLMAVVL